MTDTPAFPVFPETGAGHASAFQGMTLRDYLAAKAMQSFILDPDMKDVINIDIAFCAYEHADAMMKAREA